MKYFNIVPLHRVGFPQGGAGGGEEEEEREHGDPGGD